MTTPEYGAGLRDGEVAIEVEARRDAWLSFIGTIETPWTARGECPRQGDREAGPPCRLVLAAAWEPALEGIEESASLQVLYWMHEARRDLVRLAPRGGRMRGPFALRAPTRPNPIASAVVTLVARHGRVLEVRGLDCVSGTPLLDLKPWRG